MNDFTGKSVANLKNLEISGILYNPLNLSNRIKVKTLYGKSETHEQ
jgi:hypothetical protein